MNLFEIALHVLFSGALLGTGAATMVFVIGAKAGKNP